MRKTPLLLCILIIFLVTGCGANSSTNTNHSNAPTNTPSSRKKNFPTGPAFDFSLKNINDNYLSKKNSEFKLGSSTKVIHLDPFWRTLTAKNITDTEIIETLKEYREDFSPAHYDEETQYYAWNYSNLIKFDDGMYLLLSGHDKGIMGESLDKLNQYVHFDKEFYEYVSKLWIAYPNKYYRGNFSNNNLEYSVYFDAHDEVEVELKSLDFSNDSLTAVLDTSFSGRKDFKLSIDAYLTEDCRLGFNEKVVTLNGNDKIDISLPLNSTNSFTVDIKLSNTVYSITIASQEAEL